MNNREKAQALFDKLFSSWARQELVDELEAELDRLDAPEPKKWEPRSGTYIITSDGTLSEWLDADKRTDLGGRAYPTREEAERAAPLHRKLDRFVNWLVEHAQVKDWRLSTVDFHSTPSGKALIVFDHIEELGHHLVRAIESGEVRL